MSVYENIATLDLRHLTAEAAKQIEGISNIALLIKPKDGPAELMEAIAAIPVHNIASTVFLQMDEELTMFNGVSELDDSLFRADGKSFIICNGICIISELSPESRGRILVNGMLLMKKGMQGKEIGVAIEAVNGVRLYLDFEEYKVFQNQLELDAATISYLSPGTALLTGNQINIADDVTVEMLEEKKVTLISGNEIICNKELAPYIRVKAFVGNQIRVRE